MVLVINKVDCAPFVSGEQFEKFSGVFTKQVQTCAVTGKGISELEGAVIQVRGIEHVPSGGRRWTVNQVILCVFITSKTLLNCSPLSIIALINVARDDVKHH